MLRILRRVALPVGFVLAGWFIWWNDPGALFERAVGLGWLWIPALSTGFFWHVLFTVGWMQLLPPDVEGRPGFGRLYMIRQGGETINFITPLGTVGGEPVKVMLLGLPKSVGTASVVAARTLQAVAQIGYGVGALLVLLALRAPQERPWPLFAAAAVASLGLFLFILGQWLGAFEWIAGRLRGRSVRLATGLTNTSRQLQEYYRSPTALARSLALFVLAWVATSLEPMVVLFALGLEDFALNAVLITGIISLLSTAAVLVPASLGVMEGGLAAAFGFLGLDPLMGLTVVVVRRVRELMWIGVGMTFLTVLRKGAPDGPRPATE